MVDLQTLTRLEDVIPELASKRVVFVGENHDRLEHHLAQLAIIARLYARNPRLAIGMEFFQVPFQPYLDEYVAGRLDDRTLLKHTEYFDRWRFDYRLYQPILQFAQAHRIPVIALNVAQELVDKVSRSGLESLTPDERAQVPARIDQADARYRERLRRVFEQHPGSEAKDFERFVEVQLLWDESMAEVAARYLGAHPTRSLVVLAGNGHVTFGLGIPRRLKRRLGVASAVIATGTENDGIEPGMADYLMLPAPQQLPPAGRLGALLEVSGHGVRIESLNKGSAAGAAGVQAGDRVVAVDGRPVDRVADIKIALWDKQRGDRVVLRVRRSRHLFGQDDLDFSVELH